MNQTVIRRLHPTRLASVSARILAGEKVEDISRSMEIEVGTIRLRQVQNLLPIKADDEPEVFDRLRRSINAGATVAEAAKNERVEKGYVYAHIREGRLPQARKRIDREERARAYIEKLEAGAPYDADAGARQSIEAGYVDRTLVDRFERLRHNRDRSRLADIQAFFQHYKAGGSSKSGNGPQKGYRLLLSEPPQSPLWQEWENLKQDRLDSDRREIEEVVIRYEDDGRVLSRRIMNRITKYPELYPRWHERVMAARAKRQRHKRWSES